MQMKVTRYAIYISPENETEEAYLEEVLGCNVRDENAPPPAIKVNKATGITRIASLQITKAQ